MRPSARIAAVLLLVALGGCTDVSEKVTNQTTSLCTCIIPQPPIPKPFGDSLDCANLVFFDYDSAELTAKTRKQLDQCWLPSLERYLKTSKESVILAGHTDERGTTEYNLALGEVRAEHVRDYLIAHGIPADRLKAISYGKERPAVTGSNEDAWSQNRRVEGSLQ